MHHLDSCFCKWTAPAIARGGLTHRINSGNTSGTDVYRTAHDTHIVYDWLSFEAIGMARNGTSGSHERCGRRRAFERVASSPRKAVYRRNASLLGLGRRWRLLGAR